MKIGDLVSIEYNVGALKRSIGIVKILSKANIGLVKIHWSCGDETWCMAEQLEVIA